MAIDPPDVSRLSDDKVRALLALGEENNSTQAHKILSVLKQAIHEADGKQLSLLVRDLKSPVLTDSPGPLAFQRLVVISKQEERSLCGRTFLDVVTSHESSISTLSQLVQFGRLLTAEQFPASTQLAGKAIKSLARIAIILRRDRESGTDMVEVTTDVLRALDSTK